MSDTSPPRGYSDLLLALSQSLFTTLLRNRILAKFQEFLRVNCLKIEDLLLIFHILVLQYFKSFTFPKS